jgi:hypothetical protein
MAQRYAITGSVVGEPGILNTTNYAIPANSMTLTAANPLDAIAPTMEFMDAGIFTQIVLKNARGSLLYTNPSWMQEQRIQSGHKPRAVFFKVSDMVVDEKNPNVYRLAEGITPDSNLSMNMGIVEIIPQQFGLVVYYTDIVGAVSYLNFRTILMERLGWAIGRIVDAQVKTYLQASLSLIDLTPDAGPNITWLGLLRLWTKLEALDIRPPQSEGEWYPMIIHPHQQGDLMRDTEIKAAITHSNIGWDPARNPMVHPSRLGEAAGFRFYVTSRCATYDVAVDGTPDGYENFVYGDGLLGVTSLENSDVGTGPNFGAVYNSGDTYNNNASSPISLIEKTLGSSGASGDPLNQLGSIGAKWTWGAQLLHPSHGGRVRFTSAYL